MSLPSKIADVPCTHGSHSFGFRIGPFGVRVVGAAASDSGGDSGVVSASGRLRGEASYDWQVSSEWRRATTLRWNPPAQREVMFFSFLAYPAKRFCMLEVGRCVG